VWGEGELRKLGDKRELIAIGYKAQEIPPKILFTLIIVLIDFLPSSLRLLSSFNFLMNHFRCVTLVEPKLPGS